MADGGSEFLVEAETGEGIGKAREIDDCHTLQHILLDQASEAARQRTGVLDRGRGVEPGTTVNYSGGTKPRGFKQLRKIKSGTRPAADHPLDTLAAGGEP